ncbi:hypothetical protein CDAR_306691 [Caerostris darwini]|uniref:Uncharacterized protein n=1 Tax=Caerostris darwini TaxID=1538125 RepID=A0AAV4SGP9_9ARAC|nr:hypothetical protein CDAR_306691 [Caerostris darwini]
MHLAIYRCLKVKNCKTPRRLLPPGQNSADLKAAVCSSALWGRPIRHAQTSTFGHTDPLAQKPAVMRGPSLSPRRGSSRERIRYGRHPTRSGLDEIRIRAKWPA